MTWLHRSAPRFRCWRPAVAYAVSGKSRPMTGYWPGLAAARQKAKRDLDLELNGWGDRLHIIARGETRELK